MSQHQAESPLYNRLVEHVFSGHLAPGSKVVEGHLAKELGVSRIPVRESLRRMVGQGLLTSGADGNGIRVRQYTPDDLRQLFELRQLLEGGVARNAASAANETDFARLDYICKEADECIRSHGTREQWGELDHAFHEALADASHNDRMAASLKTLLTECHFLFYVFPSTAREVEESPSKNKVAELRRSVLETEHLTLLEHIRARDPDASERLACQTIRDSGQRIIQAYIARRFAK